MKLKRSEAEVMHSVRDLLKARSVMHFRMNVGKFKNPAGQWVEFGVPGQADLLAFPKDRVGIGFPLWVETKALHRGKQSPEQKQFESMVKAEGHEYILCRSAAELETWLRENT